MIQVVAFCRAGFEPETAADFARIAHAADGASHARVDTGSGYVIVELYDLELRRLREVASAMPPFFARDWFVARGPFALLPGGDAAARPAGTVRADRVTPLLAACAPLGNAFTSVWVEYPDTNDGKALTGLARALEQRLAGALDIRAAAPAAAQRSHTRDDTHGPARLRIFLPDGGTAYVGRATPAEARWRMGIPRLSMPGAAPSRSTLKLAEAFSVFLGDDWTQALRAGTHAVDLGAAPGGGAGNWRNAACT